MMVRTAQAQWKLVRLVYDYSQRRREALADYLKMEGVARRLNKRGRSPRPSPGEGVPRIAHD
jgi:hypothetical protein